ncbi:TATA element modulatory factor isoform X2 [Athalia rosae]|uniref:TATA element modulatory factor isoform X2 n=1 Tax=Athalia rosae TaxID=37344 RepID=UPI00203446F2|nr:TATA element modulatory factor isoform X2 [Athalia rosae]
MSWFDASGIASLAKSALKEAQKTIDKALDIKEEDRRKVGPSFDNGDNADFFAEWGITNEDGHGIEPQQTAAISKGQTTISTTWGSFAGSFFQTSDADDKSLAGEHEVGPNAVGSSSSCRAERRCSDNQQLHKNLNSMDADSALQHSNTYESFEGLERLIGLDESNEAINEEAFSKSQLVVDLDDEGIHRADRDEGGRHIGVAGINADVETSTKTEANRVVLQQSGNNISGFDVSKRNAIIGRAEPNTVSCMTSRSSIISAESDIKSSESVEVLGSRSSPDTECTTTPESEAYSVGVSTGSRMNSDSVEILADCSSLTTSPSSVEILGEWKCTDSSIISPVGVEDTIAYSMDLIFDREATMSNAPYHFEGTLEERSSEDPLGTLSHQSLTADMPLTATNLPCAAAFCQLGLPAKQTPLVQDNEQASPDSIELIPEMDCSEEPSFAEESYTSASESTMLLTVIEGTGQGQSTDHSRPRPTELIDSGSKMHGSCPGLHQSVSGTNLVDAQINLSLDSLKEKYSHHLCLALAPITTQPFRKSADALEFEVLEPSADSFGNNINKLIKNESSDCHNQVPCQVMLVHKQSPSKSSRVQSSSVDDATSLAQVEIKTLDPALLTTSSYVKNMLAEAMVEKIEAIDSMESHAQVESVRDNSPISSESRSDLVKIGSDQTSGHTSGDELETATSSDIEIISSPTGDSSSTQSRQSPAKLQQAKSSDLLTKMLNKTRGHSRELSQISIGSDDVNVEIEKLLKKIQEMGDVLEARESKLVDISRVNMELHEHNESLKSQLDSIEKCAEENRELCQITDEYTQRMSALERKFQQAIRERDMVRKQMELLKHEVSSRISPQEFLSTDAEKDQIIKELREEGEKLSKQQLQHSNIIKKLRLKERENDNTIKQQSALIEEQKLELERLKRSVQAKEDVERSQIDLVHALTAKTNRQEKEVLMLQEKLEEALHRSDTYKRSLEAAKTELVETKQQLTFVRTELKEAVETAGESIQLSAQIHELKIRLRRTEETQVRKEESLRQENAELLKQLETSEARNEALAESLSMATKPLSRQLEQLQTNLSHKTASFLKQEKAMTEAAMELQRNYEATIETNHSLREENQVIKARLSSLEAKVNTVENEKMKLTEICQQQCLDSAKLAKEIEQQRHSLANIEQSHANQVKEFQREINSLENKLSMEKAATDAEKRRNHAMTDQHGFAIGDDEPRLSPTSSIGRDSIGSLSSVWPSFHDSTIESASGRFANVYDSVRSSANNSTSMLENLQSQLKQRDGEVQQLQWELSRRNVERDALNDELSKLTLKVENLSGQLSKVKELNESLADTRTKYDALLQMYGEKVEENEELRLDLVDVKEMYKSQIDQLLKRDAS